jgi:hypothetical protein
MDGTEMTASDLASVEAILRDELARGDAVLSGATPLLHRLLASEDRTLLNDEVVARVRGMLGDLARQLLDAQAEATGVSELATLRQARCEELAAALADDSALLGHLHALAVEGRLADKLEVRSGIDPVLSPLLKELAATPDEVLAAAAMSVITAQAGFVQQQRRMALPLGELPGEHFHSALAAFRRVSAEGAEAAEAEMRGRFDESLGRLSLLARLVMRTGSNAPGALDVERSGLAVFATALAAAAGQERDVTVLAFSDRQHARLSLALRAAGLKQPAFEAQFLHFHPEAGPFEGFDDLRADSALAILAASDLNGDR